MRETLNRENAEGVRYDYLYGCGTVGVNSKTAGVVIGLVGEGVVEISWDEALWMAEKLIKYAQKAVGDPDE